MTVNPYFSSNYFGSPEQNLVENLIIEAISIFGVEMEYVPRTFVDFDELFGEDQISKFDTSYTVEGYIKTIDGWGGDGDFLSKFGLEIRDEVTFTISVRRFEEEITANDAAINRPKEGDLIHLGPEIDKRQRLFEITFVEEEEIFHQLGKLYTYEVRCKVFEYGGEEFETGISEIDDYDTYAVTTKMTLDTGTGDFQAGETAYQGTSLGASTYSGEVVSWDGTAKELVLTKVKGSLDTSANIKGDTSGADWSIASLDSETENQAVTDNDVFENNDDFIDFSEKNPFSE